MIEPPLLPEAAQTEFWSGLAEVSPAPPVTPATGPDFAVADGEAVDGEVVVAVGAVVAGVLTDAAVLPQPAAARAATPNPHTAMRRRARFTPSPSNLEIMPAHRWSPRGGPRATRAGRRQGYHPPRPTSDERFPPGDPAPAFGERPLRGRVAV
jgi:hypothetical protein